ncbi:MAG: replication initiation factor domain-containing protein [Candidatus Cloacimonetes bacterium]|nr:replication initiation factor domain-containing protein [Candidatus Cloacimonadota bacterium]
MKHLDTLYLYRECKQRETYYVLLNDLILQDHTVLGEASGRQWIDIGYCRIGVMEWEKSLRSNQYPFLIQYDWEYLYNATLNKDIDMIDFRLPLSGDRKDYKVARVDFAITRNDKKILVDAITPFRSRAVFEKGGDVETVYFGKRSNGAVFRVYDKTKEMKVKESFLKMDYLGKYFGSIENLVVFEYEMQRKMFLKKIDNFQDNLDGLVQIYGLYQLLIGSIRFFENTDSNMNAYRNRNYDLIEYSYSISEFSEMLDYYEGVSIKKPAVNKTPSFDYLVQSIQKKIFSYSQSRTDIDIYEIIDRIVISVSDDTLGEYYTGFGYRYRSKDTLISENEFLSIS